MATTHALSPAPTPDSATLSLLKAHLRLDPGVGAEDALLGHYLAAATAQAERYCNRYFTSRTLETTFDVLEPYQLPDGAGVVTAVRGYITELADLPRVDEYWNEYVKGITVSRDYPIDYERLPTYTVTYSLVATPEADVIQAILKLAADLYENRENSTTGQQNRPLSITYQRLLAPYRQD